jgi:hypothetical protein
MKTDNELKQTLSKILPETFWWWEQKQLLYWREWNRPVFDSELLYACSLAENSLTLGYLHSYERYIFKRSTWQERVVALAIAKEIS